MKSRTIIIVSLIIFSLILVAGLLGCSTTTTSTSISTQAPTTTKTDAPVATQTQAARTVVDHLNRTVVVPSNLKKVVSLHAISTEIICCLQAQDKLIALDTNFMSDLSAKFYPELKNLPAFNTDVNVEALLALHPDLVIGVAAFPDYINKLADAGLTVIAFDYHDRTTNEEIKLIGAALGKDAETAGLIDYRNTRENKITSVISTIPQAEKKSIFYLRYTNNALQTATSNTFENSLIGEAGGNNIGGGITKGTWADISLEQLLLWNPDIIMSAAVLKGGTFVTLNELKQDAKWNQLKAIQNGNVWVMPKGCFKMDCSSPENIIGLEYLAKKLYPDKFSNINLKEDLKDFFYTFYKYRLSDQEVDSILKQEGIQK